MKSIFLISLSLIAVLLGGCINVNMGFEPTADPTRFYVLGTGTATEKLPHIGMRQITLAGHLDSNKLAVRKSANEITYSEQHRWAEAPTKAITEAVATRLGAQTLPWPDDAKLRYALSIHVLNFEGDSTANQAHFSATWELTDLAKEKVIENAQTNVTKDWNSSDREALPALLTEGIQQLVSEVKAAVR